MESRSAVLVLAAAYLVGGLGNCSPSAPPARPARPGSAAPASPAVRPAIQAVSESELHKLRNGWVEVLASGISLGAQLCFGGRVETETLWEGVEVTGYSSLTEARALTLRLTRKASAEPFATYYLVPWQPLFARIGQSPSNRLTMPLLTVTEQAMVFGPSGSADAGDEIESYRNKAAEIVAEALDIENNRRAFGEEFRASIPEGLRVISLEVYPNYADMQVALPGSRLPDGDELSRVFAGRMLSFTLIPDLGPIAQRWIPPREARYGPLGPGSCSSEPDAANRSPNRYYDASQKLQALFARALKRARDERLDETARRHLLSQQRDELKRIIDACSSGKEKESQERDRLAQKVEDCLARLLFTGRQVCPANGSIEATFPDYRPKLTPDTVLDYRPGLRARVEGLPAASKESLPALLKMLAEQKRVAKKRPGRWQEGNMVLGADRREYIPSDEELMESEIGRRIQEAVAGAGRSEAAAAQIAKKPLEYRAISFRHVDVMGSGRFFYASEPQETRILPKKEE